MVDFPHLCERFGQGRSCKPINFPLVKSLVTLMVKSWKHHGWTHGEIRATPRALHWGATVGAAEAAPTSGSCLQPTCEQGNQQGDLMMRGPVLFVGWQKPMKTGMTRATTVDRSKSFLNFNNVWVYDTYNYIVYGVFKPTYNWGGTLQKFLKIEWGFNGIKTLY